MRRLAGAGRLGVRVSGCVAEAQLEVKQSKALSGQVSVSGAKNAALAIMPALILTDGVSRLENVPASADVLNMIQLLEELGATVRFDCQKSELEVDTRRLDRWRVSPTLMRKMRASVFVLGPLLSRFGRAELAMPGGCVIGARPINYHLQNLSRMGVEFDQRDNLLRAEAMQLQARRLVLEYPSVGATINIICAALQTPGCTEIVNAALEPELLDLVAVLKKMGACIDLRVPATIEVEGGHLLRPINHRIMPDRLEAGVLLLAAAMTGGQIQLPDAPADTLDLFLLKLEEMGHIVACGSDGVGIDLHATPEPRAVSFVTRPYPGFPTDLQAPMMAAQCVAEGTSTIEETVFENRLVHTRELQKMGAQIVCKRSKAMVTGVEELYGAYVIASDIRASSALVLAALAARGCTTMTGLHHWRRGYDQLEQKLRDLGAHISVHTQERQDNAQHHAGHSSKETEDSA